MDEPLIISSPPMLYPESGYTYPNFFSTEFEAASQVLKNCNFVDDSNQILETRASLKKLRCATFFCGLFMVTEFVAGYVSNSVAVYSDALHMLSDMTGFFFNIVGLRLSLRQPSPFWTYGYKRVEIVGAIFSVFLIWMISVFLCIEAAGRLLNPPKVDGKIMVIIASTGILINLILAWILIRDGHGHSHFGGSSNSQGQNGGSGHPRGSGSHVHSHGGTGSHGHSHVVNELKAEEPGHGHSDSAWRQEHSGDESSSLTEAPRNISIQSAYIHMLGDMLQNVGVLISGVLIMVNPNMFMIMDPICTLLFALNVFAVTIPVAFRAFYVLMDTVPSHVDTTELLSSIRSIQNVEAVKDFHVWNVAFTGTALTVILDVSGDKNGCNCTNRSKVAAEVRELAVKNAIEHCNIEIRMVSKEEMS